MSHAAFWKAICAEPDDDTPRLVFADWLDEQGDPASEARAEFIRAQVERAGLEPWADRALELRFRERQLLREHRDGWLDRLPKWVNRAAVGFRRGMPNRFNTTAREYLRNAGGVAKNTPLQSMWFSGLDADVAVKMAALPGLARMRSLRLGGGSWASWEALLASPHLTGLRALGLGDDADWVPLSMFLDVLRLPAARVVRRFELEARGPGAGLLGTLAEAPFDDLRHLRVTVDAVDPPRLAELLNSPAAGRLESLFFGKTLNPGALTGLTAAPELPRLKSLTLALSPQPLPELPAAFDSPPVRHLEELTLRSCFGPNLRALAESPLARRLRVLWLPECFAGPDDYRAAFAPGRFPNLVELSIPGFAGGPTLPALAATGGLASLRYLEFTGFALSAERQSLDVLAESASFPNLRGVVIPAWFDRSLYEPAGRAAFAAKYAGRFAVVVG
jgi:uncharacterized protein (TIGR02996 family)